jgi:hypothetical protein
MYSGIRRNVQEIVRSEVGCWSGAPGRGRLHTAETVAGGQPTGGATAGQPPRGTDITSKDLELRELEVTSVREATGSCPGVK